MAGGTRPRERVAGDDDSGEERERKYSAGAEGCQWTREVELD